VLKLPFFKKRAGLCIAKTLLYYLEVTKTMRNGQDKLFISFQKPYNKVKEDTLGQWIKSCLSTLGVDERFTAHSH